MRNAIIPIILVVSLGLATGFAAEGKKETAKARPSAAQTRSHEAADEKAVRESAAQFTKLFNKADAKSIGALWTADCEYVDETGLMIRGRAAMEKEYAAFFAKNPGLKMENTVLSTKVLGGKAAVEEGKSAIKNSDGKLVSKGRYTALLLKQKDKWLLASVRETAVPSLSRRPTLNGLEWLIGDWGAGDGSKRVDLGIKWIADKKFLEMSYNVRDKGSPTRSGVQIIGRDPLSGDVISWSFDSTGGYGRGRWKLLKRGVLIESRAAMADGAIAASSEILSRTSKDGLTWKSVNRSVAGRRLNDSVAVDLKRKTK